MLTSGKVIFSPINNGLRLLGLLYISEVHEGVFANLILNLFLLSSLSM